MSEEMFECYFCGGSGQVYGHRDYIDQHGRRRGGWGHFECHECKGSGQVTARQYAEHKAQRAQQDAIRAEARERCVPISQVRREWHLREQKRRGGDAR